MDKKELTILIILFLFILYFFTLFLRRLFFLKKSKKRGSVPSEGKVIQHLKNIDENGFQFIDTLYEEFSPKMKKYQFSLLSVATALSTKLPICELSGSLVLNEYFDSLESVLFIMLIEDLFEIRISDKVAEKFITFRDCVKVIDKLLR